MSTKAAERLAPTADRPRLAFKMSGEDRQGRRHTKVFHSADAAMAWCVGRVVVGCEVIHT